MSFDFSCKRSDYIHDFSAARTYRHFTFYSKQTLGSLYMLGSNSSEAKCLQGLHEVRPLVILILIKHWKWSVLPLLKNLSKRRESSYYSEHPEIIWKFKCACAHSLEVETTGLAEYKGCEGMPIIRMVQGWFETLQINPIHIPLLYLFP